MFLRCRKETSVVRSLTIVALLGCTAAVAGGCGSSSDDSGGGSSQSADVPQANPDKGEVRFLAPATGAKTGPTVTAKVALKHFEIAPGAVGQAPRFGQGHLHFTMDAGKYDQPRYSGKNGLLGKKLGVSGKYSPALAPTITYRHLPPGKHHLVVALANNNHTSVGVQAKVSFTVK
jgi:hypothetical protein